MRMTAGASLVGAALALGWVGCTNGYSQLVTEEIFHMKTMTCEGVSCRKEIIGANETLGVGSVFDCSSRVTYGNGTLEDARTDSTEKLFELVYSCQRVSADGGYEALASPELCGMVAEPCVDAGSNPDTFEITYQIAFEFEQLAYDVIVDVRLYFNYMRVNEAFYNLRSADAPICQMSETCHRSCDQGEWKFYAELEDSMGDGWNSGGINRFDHFYLDSRSELLEEVIAAMTLEDGDRNHSSSSSSPSAAAARRNAYRNTLLGGSQRNVPVCLGDGEYLFSTELKLPDPATMDPHAFAVGGSLYDESNWTFCGQTGKLSDSVYVRVAGGECAGIQDWGDTASPSTTPVLGETLAPSVGGTENPTGDDGDGTDGTDGTDKQGDQTDTGGGGGDTLTDMEILAIGLGALVLAAAAAGAGTYAQNKGWFSPAPAAGGAGGAAPGGAGAAAAGGAVGGAGAPNPDSDEFAP